MGVTPLPLVVGQNCTPMNGNILGWFCGALILILVSCCAEGRTLDDFQNLKIQVGSKACTCSFTMVEDDDIVDAKSAGCNTKCSGKGRIKLGGPPPSANFYSLEIKVSKGSVTVTRVSANLPANFIPAVAPFNPKMGEVCSKFVSECLDRDSFPNIGQAFRGYNLILGDPLNYDGDPGYEGHIFDEAGERNGLVRFGNTAGNDLNRCDGSVRADYIETAEEFLDSTMRSQDSKKWFQIGSEVEVTGTLGVDGNANVEGNANGGASLEVPYIPGVGVNGGAGVGAGAGVGGQAGVSATVTIPPLYQSVTSNSKVMTDISEGLESNQISITRSSFSCHEYEFEITESQHPFFTGQFKSAVKELEMCLMQGPPFNGDSALDGAINGTSKLQDECGMKFIRNYGTHYIKEAKYGSKMSLLTVLDSKAAYSVDKEQVAKCATKSKAWSLLGIIGGGSSNDNCMEDLFQTSSGSAKVILDEIVVTVGSRPRADYSEWADQQGKPEIIHKTIAPISDLFNTNFMADIEIKFDTDGVATIKPLLDKYLLHYCGLFRSQCNFVVAMPLCPAELCKSTTFSKCGHYTGPVDLNFLPHGKGTLTLEDEVSKMIWVHGCTADCVSQPYGSVPGGYHLATEEEVVDHKAWILDTMDKWAVAKFTDGYIYGVGFGGQVITTEIEDNYKEMVVCKNEVVETTTPPPPTPAPVTTYTFVNGKVEWLEAARYCWSKGLRLAIARTMSELNKIQYLADKYHKDVWLAGNDYGHNGHWVWASGSPNEMWSDFVDAGGAVGMDFNWEDGSGSSHDKDDENCMFMHPDGKFDEEDCDKDRYFICDDGKN